MKGVDWIVDKLSKKTRPEFEREYMGRLDGIHLPTSGSHETNPFPPPRGIGLPVFYNDKGQLVYENGERVLNNE